MKKLTALILALALSLSMGVSAFAADPVEIEVDGEIHYVDMEIYDVILPTDGAFKFAIDPLGIAAAEDGDKLSEIVADGKILSAAPALFLNNSAVPVTLSAVVQATKVKGTEIDTAPAATGPVFVEAEDALDGSANNVLLFVASGKTDINDVEDFSLATKAFPVIETARTLEFLLPAADYSLEKSGSSYNLEFVEESGHGNALRLGGLIDVTADGDQNWSEFADKSKYSTLSSIGFKAVFSFAKETRKLSEDGGDDGGYVLDAGDTEFLLEYDGTDEGDRIAVTDASFVDFVGAGAGTLAVGFYNADKTATSTTLTYATNPKVNTWFNVPFNFGEQEFASVTGNGTALTSTNYKLEADKMQFMFGSIGSKTIVIKLKDNTTYTLTVTVAN